MRGTAPPSGGGEQHEQAVVAALDLICSAPEQTYSQFLASFTQLKPESLKSEEPRDTCRDDPRDGKDGDGDTNWRGQRDPCDLPELSCSMDKAALREEDKEGDLEGCSLVPGEVEKEGRSAHSSLIIHSTQLEMSSAAKAKHSASLQAGEHGTRSTSKLWEEHAMPSTDSAQGEHTTHPVDSHKEMHTVTSVEQVDSEEVQPFHLDEDFDYDHVVLTHKYQTPLQNPKAS